MSEINTAWKVISSDSKSENGNIEWIKNRWMKHEGKLKLCYKGFHASHRLIDAIRYVTPGIICKVEYRGDVIESNDKFVCSEMRVIEKYVLSKKQWVELAVFSARLCLDNFEKVYPNDNRPRRAIEAAENYIRNPSDENMEAARSAAESASWSAAWSARSAAESAAWSAAESASWSARSAAWSARSAAESAAWSAAESAESASESATLDKIESKFMDILSRSPRSE